MPPISIVGALITPLHGLRAFAGIAVAFVWAAFLLNTALCPCEGADTVALSERSEVVSLPVANARLAGCPGEAHSEHPGQGPRPRCPHTVGTPPPSIDAPALPASGFSPWQYSAIDAPFYLAPRESTRSEHLALGEIPPPQSRLYLRTLRLLI